MLAWNSEDFIRDYVKNAVMEKLTPYKHHYRRRFSSGARQDKGTWLGL
jgi:hypothetical protein